MNKTVGIKIYTVYFNCTRQQQTCLINA